MILQGEIEKQNRLYYEFDRKNKVGEGGMGIVYRGRMVDSDTGAYREVAIKEVLPEGDEETRSRIIERAKREASLQFHSDNIVEMLGFVQTEEKKFGISKNRYFVISEFLDGVTLDKVLDGVTTDYQGNEIYFAKDLYERYTKNREDTSLYILKNVLSAIVIFHDRGYLHRDIDPSNIMVTANGYIKLIDFGISKKVDGQQEAEEEGAFVGKVEYAAPELVSGRVSQQDLSTDIYAIGVLFYRLLTGHLPFTGSQYDVVKAQLGKKPDLHEITSGRFRAVVAKALSKKQSTRYPSASSMRAALDGSVQAPSWVKYAIIGVASIAALFLILIIVKSTGKVDTEQDTQKSKDVIIIDNPVGLESIDTYNKLSLEETWGRLLQEPNNPGLLYAAANFCATRAGSEQARSYWDTVLYPTHVKRYVNFSKAKDPKAFAFQRCAYVLYCLAYENVDSIKWSSNVKEDLGKLILSMNKDYYFLPDGLQPQVAE